MKNYILLSIVALILAVVSCQSQESLSIDENAAELSLTKSDGTESFVSKYSVSTSDAIRYSELYHPGRKFSVTQFIVKRDTLLHILNYEDGGWIVIPGDRRFDPILAESQDGYLDLKSEEEYMFWFRSIADDMLFLWDKKPYLENENTVLWGAVAPKKDTGVITKASTPKWVIRSIASTVTSTWSFPVPHLTITKWGQGSPWNRKLPIDNNPYGDGTRCVTGCVSVAVAQLLYYLHYEIGEPTSLYHVIYCHYPGVISPANATSLGFVRANEVYNSSRWDDMALTAYSSGSTEYVGNLMLDVGNRFNTLYACGALGGSAAFLHNYYYSAFSAYGLSCNESPLTLSIVMNSLYSRIPVLIRGDEKNANNQIIASHAWLIDGLAKQEMGYTMTRYCEYSYDWTENDEVYDTFAEVQQVYGFVDDGDSQEYPGPTISNFYYQMNWGYEGIGDNIYYNSNDSWTVGNNTYNSNKTVYYGFN